MPCASRRAGRKARTGDQRRFRVGKTVVEFVPADDPRLASSGVTLETPVLGVEIGGVAKAYPILIMNWHEIVNDTVGGEPVSIDISMAPKSSDCLTGFIR